MKAVARQQELEQRKSAKLKFFELRSSIERLYGRVVESADRRDALSTEAERSLAAADDAESRRKTLQAGRSVRESAPGQGLTDNARPIIGFSNSRL